jgi:hypothetical protein
MHQVPGFFLEDAEMTEPIRENERGTRRQFLRGTAAAAGGAALLGRTIEVQAQAPPVRASAPTSSDADQAQLGPLRDLGGRWVGQGFNVILLPFFDNPGPEGPEAFRVMFNATVETLEFHEIGGKIPNRGSKDQKDIDLFGLTYLQRVSDADTHGALHIEPGVWLHVPPTNVPKVSQATLVRQGSIPHGTSILAQGNVIPTVRGQGPRIKDVDTTPFTAKGPIKNPKYLAPFTKVVLPKGAKPEYLKNPNQALKDAIVNQTIKSMEVLDIKTVPPDDPAFKGIGQLNIPFLIKNADVTQFEATFWVETVEQGGNTFLQLQYTQTIILNFLDINWPHITVATLVKQ